MPKVNPIVKFDIETWPYIHDTMIPGVYEFYGPDTEDLFLRNFRVQDNSWAYKNKKITYNFNLQGLRMKKNLNEVNEDFIYFSGTSFTMGIGISEKDRFSEMLSEKLSLDFINYSGPTFTIKMQILSFFNFIKKHKKPKILVIEYPPPYTYSFLDKDLAVMYHEKNNPETLYKNIYKELLNTTFFDNESNLLRSFLKTLCEECKIKLVEISYYNYCAAEQKNIISIDPNIFNKNDINIRYARDLKFYDSEEKAHPGIGVHYLAYEKILKNLT